MSANDRLSESKLSSGGYSTFPSLQVPESQKDEAWHLAYLQGCLNTAIWGGNNPAILKAFEYSKGQINPMTDHTHLVLSSNRMPMPLSMISFNVISRFINQMVGEFFLKNPKITVRANSRQAISRKTQALIEAEMDMKLLPLYEQAQEMAEMAFINENTPKSKPELLEFAENYKEQGEVVYQRLSNHHLEKYDLINLFARALRNCTWGGMSGIKAIDFGKGIEYGEIGPFQLVIDPNVNEHGEGGHYVGECQYIPMYRAIEEFNLDSEGIEKIGNSSSLTIGGNKVNGLKPYQGEDYVLMTRMYWLDLEQKLGVQSTKNGITHYSVINAEVSTTGNDRKREMAFRKGLDKDKSIPIPNRIVRMCTTLGSGYVPKGHWGVLQNQYQDPDDWQETQLPIKVFLPKWDNGGNISPVMQTISLQILINECWHKIRWAMKKDKGTFFLMDMAQKDEQYSMFDADWIIETKGYFPINSRNAGINSNYNQFQTVDTHLTQQRVSGYLSIIELVKIEINQIWGIDPARMGVIQNPSIAVGVNQASIQNSNIQTLSMFKGIFSLMEDVFEYALNIDIQNVLADPEKYQHILGDDGVAFIGSTVDFAFDNYGFTISAEGVDEAEKSVIHEMTKFAVQNGQIDWLSGVMTILEKDPLEALKKLKGKFQDSAQQMQEQNIQQMEANQLAAQNAERIKMLEIEARLNEQELKSSTQLQAVQLQNQGKLQVEKIKNRKQEAA